jgi:transcriptional regulator with XRE-family HTH domain
MSRKLRRQVLLALFRAAKGVLSDLDGLDVMHMDGPLQSSGAGPGRHVSLHQALSVATDAKAEGMGIRLRRLSFRLTQAQFAGLCELSRPHLSRIEHGKTEIEARTRAKLAFGFRRARSRYQKLQFSKDGPEPRQGPDPSVGAGEPWLTQTEKRVIPNRAAAQFDFEAFFRQ